MNNLWRETGGQQMYYTRQDDLYMKHLTEQLPNFNGGRVLEIGPGDGGFALKLVNKFQIDEYCVLDLETNIFDSVLYLTTNGYENVKHCYSKNYKDLFGMEFDLLVANVVIPETGKVYREDLLNNIIPNCKNGMIISILDFDDEYKEWLIKLFNNNFNDVKCELTTYKNCYALTGGKTNGRRN